MGLRGFAGSRVSRVSGRVSGGGGCLGCQTGPGQRLGQGLSASGEAQLPGYPEDPGFLFPRGLPSKPLPRLHKPKPYLLCAQDPGVWVTQLLLASD